VSACIRMRGVRQSRRGEWPVLQAQPAPANGPKSSSGAWTSRTRWACRHARARRRARRCRARVPGGAVRYARPPPRPPGGSAIAASALFYEEVAVGEEMVVVVRQRRPPAATRREAPRRAAEEGMAGRAQVKAVRSGRERHRKADGRFATPRMEGGSRQGRRWCACSGGKCGSGR